MVLHEVFMSCKDAGRLHRPASLRAQDALNLDSSLEVKGQAVVTDPVDFGDLIDAVALLVHWNVAVTAEHN